MDKLFERSISLLKEENFLKLKQSTVAVFGLGGVGGTAAECLARSGCAHLVLIDFDVVSESNINRQILYTSKDIGLSKAETAKSRLQSINPDLVIDIIDNKVDENFFDQNDLSKVDYVIDAIDDTSAKVLLAKYCISHELKFIMSLGMANRFDPSKVILKTLNKTENDPLAKKMRNLFRKDGLDISKINVVYSTELPVKNGTTLSSMMMVPSEAGLLLAYKVITDLVDRGEVYGN